MGCCTPGRLSEKDKLIQVPTKTNQVTSPNFKVLSDEEQDFENTPVYSALNVTKKKAVALWDFAGDESIEQIAFKAGDEIIVLEEIEGGWWWGLIGGKEGYFPVNYTEIIQSSTDRPLTSK